MALTLKFQEICDHRNLEFSRTNATHVQCLIKSLGPSVFPSRFMAAITSDAVFNFIINGGNGWIGLGGERQPCLRFVAGETGCKLQRKIQLNVHRSFTYYIIIIIYYSPVFEMLQYAYTHVKH